MLQQTQVSRVEAYYHRFLDRYPSVETLAAATPAAVRESWEGLGYYRRAANLHRWPRRWCAEHAGVIPADPSTSCASCPASGDTPPAPWRASRTSGSSRRSTPTWRGCSGARSIPRLATGRRDPATVGDGRGAGAARTASGPGSSIRRSWSWARWCARPRVARCGECPVRSACATGRRAPV